MKWISVKDKLPEHLLDEVKSKDIQKIISSNSMISKIKYDDILSIHNIIKKYINK